MSAGAKAFLDLGRTLEHLETAGVPVLGWRHDWFPAFYTRSSGHPVPHRVETAGEVAAVLANRSRTSTGVLLTVPIPEADELDPAELDAVLDAALADADRAGISGAAVTPFVLGRIAEATSGRSVPANLALAEHNAAVAAEVAVAVAAHPSVDAVRAGRCDVRTLHTRHGRNVLGWDQRLEPRSLPLRRTVTGPSSLTTMTVAAESSKL